MKGPRAPSLRAINPDNGAPDGRLIYRKVSDAINRDDRYLALSPIPPCGRGLFHHLLFGPHVSSLPGVSNVGRASMAEAIGWELDDFDAAFAEVEAQGLAKADWQNRVVYLPNAIKHNPPQSPNVVRSWRLLWDRIPDCELKLEAYEKLRAAIIKMGPAFSKPFTEAFAKPSGKPSVKAFAKPSGKPSAEPSGKSKPYQEAGSSSPIQEKGTDQDSTLRPRGDEQLDHERLAAAGRA